MSAFIDVHRDRFGVEPICRTLGVSASAYYQRATGQRSARQLEDERLVQVIRQTHKKNFEAYGYRKLWKTLRRAGETAPRPWYQWLATFQPFVLSGQGALVAHRLSSSSTHPAGGPWNRYTAGVGGHGQSAPHCAGSSNERG